MLLRCLLSESTEKQQQTWPKIKAGMQIGNIRIPAEDEKLLIWVHVLLMALVPVLVFMMMCWLGTLHCVRAVSWQQCFVSLLRTTGQLCRLYWTHITSLQGSIVVKSVCWSPTWWFLFLRPPVPSCPGHSLSLGCVWRRLPLPRGAFTLGSAGGRCSDWMRYPGRFIPRGSEIPTVTALGRLLVARRIENSHHCLCPGQRSGVSDLPSAGWTWTRIPDECGWRVRIGSWVPH